MKRIERDHLVVVKSEEIDGVFIRLVDGSHLQQTFVSNESVKELAAALVEEAYNGKN